MSYDNPFNPQQSGIMANFLKALQAYSAVQQIKGDQQDRQFRQDNALYERGQNERQFSRQEANDKFGRDKYAEQTAYGQKQDKLESTLKMAQLGARAGNPALELALTQSLGAPRSPRQAATLPSGETYYLPTQEETTKRKLDEAVKMGKLDVANAILMQHALLPGKVGEIEARQKYEQQYATPKAPHIMQTDTAGVGIDPQTGQTLWSNPALAKPKTATEGHPAKTSMEKIEGRKADAQKSLKEAQFWKTQMSSKDEDTAQKAKNNYYLALAAAKAAEDEAKGLAAGLKQAYPKNFKYTVDKDNNISIDWRD